MIETAKDVLRKSVDPLNLSKFGQRLATDKKYRKRTAKDALGAAATFADSALFGAPSAIKPVAKSIERLERKNPNLHTLSEIGGFLGGSALPGVESARAFATIAAAARLNSRVANELFAFDRKFFLAKCIRAVGMVAGEHMPRAIAP
jgi:hypothetical protein